MRFLLYCHQDVRDLGIVDKQGNWDLVKFREHIESCPKCAKVMVLTVEHLLNKLKKPIKKNKGSQLNDCPETFNPPTKGERARQ